VTQRPPPDLAVVLGLDVAKVRSHGWKATTMPDATVCYPSLAMSTWRHSP